MPVIHPLLEGQLKALGCGPHRLPEDADAWRRFLDRVDQTYWEIEADLEAVHQAVGGPLPAAAGESSQPRLTQLIGHTLEGGGIEDELRRAMSWAGDINPAMLVLDGARRVVAANPLAVWLTGLEPEQMLGREVGFLTNPSEAEPPPGLMWSEAARDGVWSGDLRICDARGGEAPTRVSLYRVSDHEGEAAFFVVCLTELVERGHAQQGRNHVGTHDPLTGLSNRALFRDRLERAIRRSQRSGLSGALLFIDLDRFKAINDSLGHQVGDELLIRAAQRFRKISRREDLVSRIGGDEFAVIVEQLKEPEQAASVARKLAGVFDEAFSLRGYEFRLSASIGVTLFPDEGTDAGVLLKQADAAMYRAKQQGGGGFRFFTPQLTDLAAERYAMELRLREAADAGQLMLLYQPLFDLRDGALVAVEALLRWRHPELGLVVPGRFLHLAEVTGVIDRIGEWTLREACRQLVEWAHDGSQGLSVSVNLSRQQILRPDFSRRLNAILEQSGADSRRLELEIAEPILRDCDAAGWRNLAELQELGCGLIIDDFGSASFSIPDLVRYGFRRLKTQAELNASAGGQGNQPVVLRATVAMARALGIRVVAKGVQSEAQHHLALAEGCDEVQGLLYSPPTEAERITGLPPLGARGLGGVAPREVPRQAAL